MNLPALLDAHERAARETGVGPDADTITLEFDSWVNETRGHALYPAQEEALLALALDSNVILSTPTGTGKSLVALGAHFIALAAGRRTVYTAPIKALVSEKFFDLVDVFGTDRVGMITGDTSINPGAPILCCTAEILANLALRDRDAGGITQVVMDEFHYYAEPDRGWAWQVPLLTMPNAQFLLMSATLGDVTELGADLTRRTGRDTALVTGVERPVPLEFAYAVKSAHEVVEDLLERGATPAYLVHFNQSHAVEQAQALSSIRLVDRAGRDAIADAIGAFRFTTGFGTTLSRLVRSGVGVHHAGMLPRYRRLVEQLAQRGLLRVICGTDTLGVGINVPIRTVVITALTKFDGVKMRRLAAREFHQIAGRAGRAGYDTEGDVIALAPEHEVENVRAQQKAEAKATGGKKAKPVKKKAPPQGFVSWGEATLDKLVQSAPEPLVSRMQVSHSMVLSVIARGERFEGEALAVMRTLIFDSHEPRSRQFAHARTAIEIFRTLRRGGIVTLEEDARGHGLLALTVDLQDDFALNQPLSPFALAAIELLDPASPTYALDVISIIEATLENPRAILRAQEHRERGEAIAAMKAEGIEYEERMELLENVTHPQPLKELLDEAFQAYIAEVPWARDFSVQPKSVVRDMVERAFGFRDVVSFYQLGRAEGGVLRYLSDAYRALSRTVPERAKTDELTELIDWLGELVRQVDSSLVDEWESLANLDAAASDDDGLTRAEVDAIERARAEAQDIAPPAPRSVLANERAFTVMVRNALFRRVQAAAFERIDELVQLDAYMVAAHGGGSAPVARPALSGDEWRDALDRYFAEYDRIGVDADARASKLLHLDRSVAQGGAGAWTFRQVLDDPAGDHDWGLEGTVDLPASQEAGEPVIRVEYVGPHRG